MRGRFFFRGGKKSFRGGKGHNSPRRGESFIEPKRESTMFPCAKRSCLRESQSASKMAVHFEMFVGLICPFLCCNEVVALIRTAPLGENFLPGLYVKRLSIGFDVSRLLSVARRVFGLSFIPRPSLPADLRCFVRLRDLELRCPASKLTDIEKAPGSWLASLEPLGLGASVNTLVLREHSLIENLSGAENCTSMRSLFIRDCDRLWDVRRLAFSVNLQVLKISNCQRIFGWPFLRPTVRVVCLKHVSIPVAHIIRDCSRLDKFVIQNCRALSDITAIAGCKRLRRVSLAFCRAMVDITPLSNIASLIQVSLTGTSSIHDISPLVQSKGIKYLDLRGLRNVQDFSCLTTFEHLENLYLDDCGVCPKLDLTNCHKLRSISIDSTELTTLNALHRCSLLTTISARFMAKLVDVSVVQSLPELKEIFLTNCDSLTNVIFLFKCPKITQIECTRSPISMFDCNFFVEFAQARKLKFIPRPVGFSVMDFESWDRLNKRLPL